MKIDAYVKFHVDFQQGNGHWIIAFLSYDTKIFVIFCLIVVLVILGGSYFVFMKLVHLIQNYDCFYKYFSGYLCVFI